MNLRTDGGNNITANSSPQQKAASAVRSCSGKVVQKLITHLNIVLIVNGFKPYHIGYNNGIFFIRVCIQQVLCIVIKCFFCVQACNRIDLYAIQCLCYTTKPDQAFHTIEDHRFIIWLTDKVRSPQFQTAFSVDLLSVGSHHNHRDIAESSVALHLCEQFKSITYRHSQIR